MNEGERVKLLYGPYKMPRCKIGGVLPCEMRGEVIVRGISAGPIQWPFTRVGKRNNGPACLILCGDLVKAVKRESAAAIRHHWRVSGHTVWLWRRELGVDATNEGTSDLRSRWAPETIQSDEAIAKRAPTLKSPERTAKIAAARQGKPRPRHVIETLIKANKGRKHTDEARRNMSAAQKRRGVRPPAVKGPPWTSEEDALLGTMKDRQVGERIGRSEASVSDRRYDLGVAAFTKRAPRKTPAVWTPEKERLLGTMPDTDLARKLRCSPMAVFYRRKRLKITAFRS